MTDVVATDARRTKNSIIFYIALTAALSSIFYVLVIHRSSAGPSPGFLILGLMWCPGVSGLLTRLAFQGNLRGLGLGRGQTKYQFASYWIPLAYSSCVYVPLWLAGYYDSNNRSLAAHAPPPESAARDGGPDPFLASRHSRRAGFVSFCAGRRARLARISRPPTCQGHFLSAGRDDQWRHLGALALPNHTVRRLSRRRPVVVFPGVLYGDGVGNQLSLRLDALEVRQCLDRRTPARQPQSLCAGLFRCTDASRPSYRPLDHRIRRRPRDCRPYGRHYFLCQAR